MKGMLNFPEHLNTTIDTPIESVEIEAEPNRVLESIVNELEQLRLSSDAPTSLLIDLHSALLLFGVGGRKEELPNPAFGLSPRRLLERRVVAQARRIAGSAVGNDAASAAIDRADALIASLLYLIDPELADMQALAS